ncbi:MAG: PEP-CTERM sorting domain-containing protein [Gemmataceae bacterium]
MKRTLRHFISLAAVAVFALGIATSAARAGLRPDLFPPPPGGGVGGIDEGPPNQIPDPAPPGGIAVPPGTPEPATLVMGLTAVGLVGLRKLRTRKQA